MYLVKWKNTEHPEIPVDYWYGTVDNYGLSDEERDIIAKAKEEGKVVVSDDVFPERRIRSLSDLTEVEMKFDRDSEENVFHSTVDEYYSKQEPDTFGKGSLFSLPVADGSATYLVKRLGKKTATVTWFGAHNLDRYTDHHFGWGGTFPLQQVKRYVDQKLAMDKLFKRR